MDELGPHLDSTPKLLSYLSCSYVPGVDEAALRPFADLADEPPLPTGEEALLEEAGRRIGEVFDDIVGRHDRDEHVVPISGGIDSRLVLGEVVARLGPRNVHSITIGVPGAADSWMGRKVAQTLGVPNDFVSLDEAPLTTADLVEFARGQQRPSVLFNAYAFRQIRNHGGSSLLYWSGYENAVTDYGRFDRPTTSWGEAIRAFVGRNALIHFGEFDPEAVLPLEPLMAGEDVPYMDQLELSSRVDILLVVGSF